MKKKRNAINSTADLARQLGLSRWTVSRALNGHSGVKATTVRRVRKAMETANFTPSLLAQGLRKGRTNVIGVCLPEIEGFYLGPKVESLRECLARAGYQIIIGMTNGEKSDETRLLEHFAALRPSAIVSIASQLSRSQVNSFLPDDIPTLRIDPLVDVEQADIGLDRTAALCAATHHLLSLGHRRIALVGMEGGSHYTFCRLAGVRKAMKEQQLSYARCIIPISVTAYATTHERRGWLAAEIIAQARPSITAALAVNDRTALGLIDGLRSHGLRVPDSISVVGYDNISIAEYVYPKLTTIDARENELMQLAATALLQTMAGSTVRAALGLIAPKLIVRDSTDFVAKLQNKQGTPQ
ncbi:MAG: LacI family DNA-binding transcriptional regulator [Blastochloris sp.]|nr:LacI family DNA-binding transcriptional regulator [Blastochloris sp.]